VFRDRSAAENEHATRVRVMFAKISARYDLLNHLLSANMDKGWRAKVASELRPLGREPRVLDVACGTGDLALELFESIDARVIGIDFCRPMLEIARRKASQLKSAMPFIEGDALNLPFKDGSFDVVTIGFGLRNLARLEEGLSELLRVLKPAGIAAVLEFSKPTAPGFRSVYRLYFTKMLPVLGRAVSGSKEAYQYLPDSVLTFPDQQQLAKLMRDVGFEGVRFINLTGGIAAIHLGKKPG
jgi:demethylmenaquinone methyltransferase / 2-methoxy-6-polyprenyl-1,4-benzoquinol methylase